jgi:hypothetical protein
MHSLRLWNLAVISGFGLFWLSTNTRREKPLVAASPEISRLEHALQATPGDGAHIRDLATAYLDARLSGLAVALLAAAPEAVRRSAATLHVKARIQLEQGRAGDALATEQQVLSLCAAEQAATCTEYLKASAAHRASIFQELVDKGIQDPAAYPEASNVALSAIAREARSLP